MELSSFWSWMGRRSPRKLPAKHSPRVLCLEDRVVPAGYLAMGAGFGAPPLVAIRNDIIDSLIGNPPNSAGQPPPPSSDGRTDVTSQVFAAYNVVFRGGVRVASGNFDGNAVTPDQLITAAGPGGGPHVIMWDMVQAADGKITVQGKRAEFMAYDSRFIGGLNITCGDLDGDGRAELITGPDAGGGPHVKIWKFDVSDSKFVLVNQFMAYETTFLGGINVASGQGYQAPFQIRQVLDSQLPAVDNGPFGSNFEIVPYDPEESIPGFDLDIPLVSGAFFLGGGSLTPDDANPPLTLPYVTVGGGTFQFGGANLLNSLGNIIYEPNVIDPQGENNSPPELPLVFATWAEDDENIPEFAIPDVVYGPFVDVNPGGDATVVRLQAPADQPNARNQLVVTPGVGGGPIVNIYDFINNNGRLEQNGKVQFNAFEGEPALENSRTGLKAAIGNVVDNPMPDLLTGLVVPNVQGVDFGGADITFPFSTNYYRNGTAQIIVTQASGGRLSRVFADFNPLAGGIPASRQSIEELELVPVVLGTQTIFDPDNPLGGYQSVVDFVNFDQAIDPQFTGTVFSAVSHLPMTTTLNIDGTINVNDPRGANIYAAGNTSPNQSNRGPRVRIFDDMGPNVTYTLSDGSNPDGAFVPGGTPIFPGGNTPYLDPVDSFSAFTGEAANFGVSGVTFGFGRLIANRTAIIELEPITVSEVSNPILL